VEILATPRPGTEVAHDEGVVVVIDTAIDAALRAEGDAREIVRAVQDLRKHAGLALDDLIELWLDAPLEVVRPLDPHLARVARDTLAAEMHRERAPAGIPSASQAISGGVVGLAIRGRRDGAVG
jgi:isoleucyl-tRNA synthetase